MKKVTLALIVLTLSVLELSASDNLFISTNKSHYVVGEQVLFNVDRFKQNSLVGSITEDPIYMDLVNPLGKIVKTKSLIKKEDGCYFFSLPDSLETGIYRLIANGKDANQSIKKIHVFELDLKEQDERQASTIEYKIVGDVLVKNSVNKIVARVMDRDGAGLITKGTLVNSVDSLVQYLDSDANGITSFDFLPTDSLYKIRFGDIITELKPEEQSLHSVFSQIDESLSISIFNIGHVSDTITVKLDGEISKELISTSNDDSLFVNWSAKDIGVGMHTVEVSSNQMKSRNYRFLNRPVKSQKNIGFENLKVQTNEQVEISLEDADDRIDFIQVSIIDHQYALNLDFYEEYFFDQLNHDLLLVEDRNFDAYLTFFGDKVTRDSNEERLNAPKELGVLNYKNSYPFDELSMLDLTSMKVLDMRCENINGIEDFEKNVNGRTQVFPYHFTTYLQPIGLANFKESVEYQYPKITSKVSLGEREIEWVKAYDMQKNINLSFVDKKRKAASLPDPDYVFELKNFDVPNTMVDMINYIVKYVSVIKNKDGEPELSMYRYMSTYKYRGNPLMFLNDMPVYNTQTILNLNPKDFERVEVRNSYQSNGHLGNFSLNGSVSFYLKEGVDNPLEDAYKNLPVLEACTNFNKKPTDSEFAPDFRHQLFWNSKVTKNNGTFWIDLKASDLSASYDVQVTAFLKDGTVINNASELVVN